MRMKRDNGAFKRWVMLSCCAALVALLSGCARQEQTALSPQVQPAAPAQVQAEGVTGGLNREEVYYTVGMHINVPYWQMHKRGLEVAAGELGVRWVFTGETGNDAAKQMDIFNQVLEKQPAGILLSPINPDAMVPSIDRAIEMGIPVICIDTDAPKSKRLCYIGTDNYNSGCMAADILAQAIGDAGEVGVLCIPGVFSIDERVDGFKTCIEENHPNIHVVSVQNDEGDPTKASAITSQMLQAFPNLQGIYGANSISGVGVAAALREADKIGKVKIVCMDRDLATLELVEEGLVETTVVQRTFTMSYYGTKFLYDYVHGAVADGIEDENPLPRLVDTGFVIVNKDNVAKYK